MKTTTLHLFFGSLFLTMVTGVSSQAPSASKLYMPPDIRQAYLNNTRSYDGLPGKNLWQNTCTYKIEANMNPYTRELTGREWIRYTNNSPDTLGGILLNAYQDVYKKGSIRDLEIKELTEGDVLDYIIVDADTINPEKISSGYSLVYFPMKKKLSPHSSVNIEISWKVRIVRQADVREGYADSTSAFIGLWYPKIAVYDDLFKWNQNMYNLKDEFYSPLSNYNVSVTLPEGFMVWATGTLSEQNNYPENVREKLNEVLSGSDVVAIIDSSSVLLAGAQGKKTWNFRADSVPDFAFAFSDHFLWDAATLILGNRKVLVSTVYPKEQTAELKEMTEVIRSAMATYSKEDPGVEYPYSAFTTFYGLSGGGMEYPMMSFDNTFPSVVFTTYVLIHEMLHTYVPFYLRTNETSFAWMDEGMTDFYTFHVMKKLNYNLDELNAFEARQSDPVLKTMGNLPLLTPTLYDDIRNMSGMWYKKPRQMLTALEDLAGNEAWRQCYNAFIRTWRNRAPMTYDFIFFVENYLKRDLFWFWDAWFMHFGYPDLAVRQPANNKVTVENKGGLPIPFTLIVTGDDGRQKSFQYHADSWNKGRLFEISMPVARLSKIEIQCNLVEDYDPGNNVWKKAR